MILRIYWTDRYQRQHAGISGVRKGIRLRLAKRFGVSVEVIKKVLSMKQNQNGHERRARFNTVDIQQIKQSIKRRMKCPP